jgi:hypothetical protein
MRVKLVPIDPALHRDLAIRSAMSGETMKTIAGRGIRRELERLAKKESRKLQPITSDGSQAGA